MQSSPEKFPNITLEDDRVILRPLEESDYNNLLPFSLNEKGLWFYSLVRPEGEDGLKNYISIAMTEKAAGKEFPFIVFDKQTNEYAGSTRFYDINFPYKTLQLGYTWYGKKFHGTGLNKHCKSLLLQFAFEQLSMERVEFRADARNERSIAAMKSLGCKVDGILRRNMPTMEGDVRRDSIVLSILKDEWFDGVKENLKKRL
ncbi:GNAT family N-acetyltransferase [Parafilimonas terrae]|uniref:Protein N-acetyltransferase, RimJ/RimL family n=1 Tax=Parafilimonas terrae TaxID=1465490 RepID=A0A1I5RRY8_9BACT|nr:GNAT family protein [Parafilimonas terrae]SFP61294.1 Protein N-acetyltransferase, RimJ/RimL family [Parafilimonas terrae]